MPEGPVGLQRFSTDMIPEQDRYEIFREEYARQVVRLDVERHGDTPFHFEFEFLRLSELNCGTVKCSPGAYGRDGAAGKDGNDDFVFFVNSSAPFLVTVNDAIVGTDEAVLLANSRSGAVVVDSPASLINISIPKKSLLALVPDMEDRVAMPIASNVSAVRLLKAYVDTLLHDPSGDTTIQAVAGQHILELVALASSANNGGGQNTTTMTGVTAARFAIVKQAIQKNLSNPAMSLDTIAALNGISARQIQRLFSEHNCSFANYVLELRLAHAYRQLTSPLQMHRRIADIAFSCGFSDLSHFNRAFRRRYGATPSDIRRS